MTAELKEKSLIILITNFEKKEKTMVPFVPMSFIPSHKEKKILCVTNRSFVSLLSNFLII